MNVLSSVQFPAALLQAESGVTAHKIQKLCESVHLYVDTHPVPQEPPSVNPHGLLLGMFFLKTKAIAKLCAQVPRL